MLSATPDSAVTTAGTPVTIDVLANDTGTGLVITSFSNPANGSLVYNSGDKSFTYTPAAGFVGDDTFSYTVRDAQGTPATAEVTISVVASGGATVATDDHVEVVAGGSVIVPVLANDMAAGGGELQIIAVSNPRHGVVNVLPDQRIRYVPQSGFVGIDNFTYTVLDQQGVTASATVTVKVVTENTAPIAMDDSFSVVADTTTVLAVLANDSDPDGGTLQVVGFTMPSHGNLVFNSADKTFAYTPAAGYEGQDQFTYTIRDNRGASASASVTLNIVGISEIPDAVDDRVTIEAGKPAVIDVLANDNLPYGEEIKIVAVTLPHKGKLVVNPDKTVTYTPKAGFVGTDDFSYTIATSRGDTSWAIVTVDVVPVAAGTPFANGYLQRRRIVMPAQSTTDATVEHPVILFAREAGWLRSTANGGAVVSAAADDIRFELVDGTKLDHEIERYDPVAGALVAWIRLPSWALAEQQQVFIYYGNPSTTGSEADPAGVWQGYLARWRLPDGSDATANGRDLTAFDVQPGELLGDAANLDGDGRLTLADASWLDGLSMLTVQALVEPAAGMVGNTARILAQESDPAGQGSLSLGYLAETDEGVGNVVYAAFGSSDDEAAIFSRADEQTSERQLIHAEWQSDNAPRLYLNGAPVVPSSSRAGSGPLQIDAGPLEIGTGWSGLIDEVRLTDRTLPAAWIAAEARNMLTPELSHGLGGEETTATLEPPIVAVPLEVEVEAGKTVDVGVLANIFAAEDSAPPVLVSVGQAGHGEAAISGAGVRYTPAPEFVGKDQFTYTVGNGKTQSTAWIVVSVVEAVSEEQSGTLPGENLLLNSKLEGTVSTAAANWSNRFPGEGTIIYATTDIPEHRQVRLVATATDDRAAIEQTYEVKAGERYVFSVYCAALGSAADPSRVVINHAPFAMGAVVGGLDARPKLGDMVPGERFHYVFDATTSGTLKLVVGLDGPGDVTLERPMLDRAATLRGYVATQAHETLDMTDLDWQKVPYNGHYEGAVQKLASAIMSQRIQGGYHGYRMTIRRSGTLDAVQVHLASNRRGETSKSRVNGANDHGFPASWQLRFQVFNADASWQISGGALHTTDFTYTNPAGGSDEGRVLFEFDVDNLAVSAGQRLLFLFSSRDSNPTNNHCSINMVINGGWPGLGLEPPRAVSLFMGDDPLYVLGSGTLTPRGRGELYNLGIRYTDGVEEGDVGHDASPSAHRTNIGGANRVRQRWSSPYWRRASQIALAVYRRPNLNPQAGLTVQISGPDISTVQLIIPASQIQQFDEQFASSYTYTHQVFTLPSELLLSPDNVYTVEISSPNSDSDRYRIHTMRHYRDGLARAAVSSVYPTAGVVPIEPHKWSGQAEKSTNGGGSWSPATWAGGGADLPFALVTARRMARTIGALPT